MTEITFRAHRQKLHFLLVLAGAAAATIPLFTGPLPATHDGFHHLFRLFELDRCLRAWELYPRIFPDMGFGYGYPVLNFYAPLSYYAGWVWAALGAGYIGAVKLSYLVAFLAAGVAMYLWAMTFLPPAGALLSSIAYTFVPYHIADAYVRGALAETFAFVWPPLIMWLLTRHHSKREPVYLPLLSLAVAAFILTHNLTALMFALPLALYFLLLYGLPHGKQGWLTYLFCCLAVLVGAGASAFFWLPAITESQYVLAGTVRDVGEIPQLLQSLPQWLSPYLIHRYTPNQGVSGQHPFSIAQSVAAILGFIGIVLHWRKAGSETRAAITTVLAVTLAALFFLTPSSDSLWRSLPGLSLLQFPWRLQAVLSLTTATLTGCVALLPSRIWQSLLASLAISATIALSSMAGLPREAAHLPGSDQPLAESQVDLDGLLAYDYQTALWLREYGGQWLLEYLPIWALSERESFFLPQERNADLPAINSQTRVSIIEDKPLNMTLSVESSRSTNIVFHRFYFPGWAATAGGHSLPTEPLGSLGLASTQVPAGQHQVQFRLGSTWPRSLGLILTGASLAALLAYCFNRRLRGFLAASAAIVAIFLALVAMRAYMYPVTLRPQPVQALLGEEITLVGYSTLVHSDKLDVRLYWLALEKPQKDYRVFLHFVDANGTMLAQHDGQPGNEFTPTSRWLPGEIVVDRHTLSWDGRPGTLYAGLYTWPEVTNLPVSQQGESDPAGRVVLGPVP